MENASKALVMAGGILIGLIILSIASYLFLNFGEKSDNIQKQINEKVLAEFNSNFLKYQGSNECTIHDIVSLTNFAKRINNNIELDSSNASDRGKPQYTHVYLENKDLTTYTEEQLMNLLKDNSINYDEAVSKLQYYKVINIGFSTLEKGKINSITFKKI